MCGPGFIKELGQGVLRAMPTGTKVNGILTYDHILKKHIFDICQRDQLDEKHKIYLNLYKRFPERLGNSKVLLIVKDMDKDDLIESILALEEKKEKTLAAA